MATIPGQRSAERLAGGAVRIDRQTPECVLWPLDVNRGGFSLVVHCICALQCISPALSHTAAPRSAGGRRSPCRLWPHWSPGLAAGGPRPSAQPRGAGRGGRAVPRACKRTGGCQSAGPLAQVFLRCDGCGDFHGKYSHGREQRRLAGQRPAVARRGPQSAARGRSACPNGRRSTSRGRTWPRKPTAVASVHRSLILHANSAGIVVKSCMRACYLRLHADPPL